MTINVNGDTGQSLNRTFMELKLVFKLNDVRVDVRLNRTFMELKLGKMQLYLDRRRCLNRTIMELKRMFCQTCLLNSRVLIVPLWN